MQVYMVFCNNRSIKICVFVFFPAILSVTVTMSKSSEDNGTANGNSDDSLPELIVFDLGKNSFLGACQTVCVNVKQ